MTLVILAAGMGSRYGGLKQLEPFTENGEFIIDFSVFDAIRAGFDKVVFIIKRENYDLFRETVGKRVENHINAEYVFQETDRLPQGYEALTNRVKPWGTAHALLCAEKSVTDNFAVINADDFYGREAFVKLAGHLKTLDGICSRHFCMIGYTLRKTLTENGTVSRGQCVADEKDMLVSITERTSIMKDGKDAKYLSENGEWIYMDGDTVVSMNCWGLTPAIFGFIEKGFAEFLTDGKGDILKKEYYLPAAVDDMMKKGLCDVKVYPTSEEWYGVTYPEDKQMMTSAIQNMVKSGKYPQGLWN